jgi:hypothetical protein
MPLPPFNWKSALLYLIGVVAVLLCVWFLINGMMTTQPKMRVPPVAPNTTRLEFPSPLQQPALSQS